MRLTLLSQVGRHSVIWSAVGRAVLVHLFNVLEFKFDDLILDLYFVITVDLLNVFGHE